MQPLHMDHADDTVGIVSTINMVQQVLKGAVCKRSECLTVLGGDNLQDIRHFALVDGTDIPGPA
jgi:hypothetical protein